MIKYFIILAFALIVSACSEGHPVPPEAFTSCIDAGGQPVYHSQGSYTKFECKLPNKVE